MSTHQLSQREARRIIVRAALLDAQRAGDVVEVAEQIGTVKIDPTSVIAPCEDTVLWSRIGWPYEPGQLVKAVEIDRLLFEYDGAFRPSSLLPLMLPAMREDALHPRDEAWLTANERFRREVLARLAADGPLTAAEIPDTAETIRPPDGWTGTGQVPTMLALLARKAEVAVTGRSGRQRRWDLAERVFPSDLPALPRVEADRQRAVRALQSHGLARAHAHWSGVASDTGEAAVVEGSRMRFRVDPDALEALGSDPFEGRAAFLNPYDPLLFDRRRLEEVFGLVYVLEQFKPKGQRRYGAFAQPILCGDRFIGMLDAALDRERDELRVNALHDLAPWSAAEAEAVRAELDSLARWLGAELTGVP